MGGWGGGALIPHIDVPPLVIRATFGKSMGGWIDGWREVGWRPCVMDGLAVRRPQATQRNDRVVWSIRNG